MYKFDAKDATEKCVEWIRNWFEQNGKGCNAVLGISGGKDSSITAALCVKALGKERVIGVMMPQGEQFDIDYSKDLCEFLGIKNYTVNIKDAVDGVYKAIGESFEVTQQTRFNLPARIRMAAVYAVSQSNNGRVANTCNYSEDYVGYATRYGDGARRFQPHFLFHRHRGQGHGKIHRTSREIYRKTAYRRALRQNRRGQSRLYIRNSRQIHPRGCRARPRHQGQDRPHEGNKQV